MIVDTILFRFSSSAISKFVDILFIDILTQYCDNVEILCKTKDEHIPTVWEFLRCLAE